MLLLHSIELLKLHDVIIIEEEDDDEGCIGYGIAGNSGTWYIYDGDEWYPFPDNWRF